MRRGAGEGSDDNGVYSIDRKWAACAAGAYGETYYGQLMLRNNIRPTGRAGRSEPRLVTLLEGFILTGLGVRNKERGELLFEPSPHLGWSQRPMSARRPAQQ